MQTSYVWLKCEVVLVYLVSINSNGFPNTVSGFGENNQIHINYVLKYNHNNPGHKKQKENIFWILLRIFMTGILKCSV